VNINITVALPLCEIVLKLSPKEKKDLIREISDSLYDLHEYIAERDLNIVDKNVVLEILEPLAEKLEIKLTEKDLP
jgi:hypothetical protein